MKINNMIKEIRKRQKLSREKLAEMVGTTPTTVYRKESGMRKLTENDINIYSAALGVSPSELIGNSTTGSLSTTPIIGFINSEGIVELFDCEEKYCERIDCPPYLDPKKAKAYRFFMHDKEWVAFIEEVALGLAMPGVPPEFIDELCIVVISKPDNTYQTLFKYVKRGSKAGHYDLHGLDSSETVLKDCFVKSSLFIEGMRRNKK